LILTYSGRSAPSAWLIAEEGGVTLNRGSTGDINWGRARANTSLNPDISNSTNKRVMRQLFAENDVPMPQLLNTQQAVRAVLDGKVVIGRPDTHSKGRGLWRCRTPRDINRALRGTRRKRAATHFMAFVEAPREYRVHIFLGRSIRISEKSFFIDDNGRKDYVTTKPQHEISHVRRAAKKAVKAVGLDFGAVDILANDTECWVLEVNSSPGLGGSTPRLYADWFRRWERGELDE
jgi:glutathione synthase/RimK-type ligase-like ATP-grasp enzyme